MATKADIERMIAMGYSPEDVVDRVLAGLSPENRQQAIDNPSVRRLLVRVTEYAATRLNDKLAHLQPEQVSAIMGGIAAVLSAKSLVHRAEDRKDQRR